MAGSIAGSLFRVATAGESHGAGQVVIVDGCPAGLPLSEDDLRPDLIRRRPGQSKIVSQRKEGDDPEVLSGVFEGSTTGTPIAVLVRNSDAKSKDYEALRNVYRPGHADFSFDQKFGRRDHRGGGRSSARETVSRVVAGAIAKKLLGHASGVEIVGYVTQVGELKATISRPVQASEVETLPDGQPNLVRCPDPVASQEMAALIMSVRKDQDSIGGIAEIVARGVPAGLGEPVFDKLKADLGKALFSLPAVIGVEYGSGFSGASMRGSVHNDVFESVEGSIRTKTNRHGGMLGGISTGMPIVLRAAVKPTSSLPRAQETVTRDGEPTSVQTFGRHDPCLLPRFVPMAEAVVAMVLADHWLRQRANAPL